MTDTLNSDESLPGSSGDSFQTKTWTKSRVSTGVSKTSEDPRPESTLRSVKTVPSQVSAPSASGAVKRLAPKNPLGLSVIYSPDGPPKADIVFIHGLGGSSHGTWLKNKDMNLFWPQTFLPLEQDVSLARILTFGYNAELVHGRPSVSIFDFANDLLFSLKYKKGADEMSLKIGDVCKIFVQWPCN